MDTDNQNIEASETTSGAYFPGGKFLGSLKTRMLVSFVLLFALVILIMQSVERYGVPFSPYRGTLQQNRVDAFEALSLTADIKKDRLTLEFEGIKKDTLMFADNNLVKDLFEAFRPDLAGSGAGNSYSDVLHYLEKIRTTYPAYERIDILGPDQTIVVSTDSMHIGAVIPKLPPALVANLSPGQPSMAFWKSPEDGKMELLSMYPAGNGGSMNFKTGTFMLFHVDADKIIDNILHTGGGLGETGEALIIDRDVRILAPLKFPLRNGTRARPLDYQISAEPAVRAARGEEGIIATGDYRGEKVLAAYRYIPISPDYGWGMVVKRDEAEIFKLFKQSEFQVVLIGIIFILLTVVISTLLAESLSKPLNSLSQTAQSVELGNLDVRASVTGTIETKTLAEALNSMLDRYQSWTRDLDEKVRMRTAQLDEKNEELEQLVYVTSHDLRSPLVNIQGFSRELERVFLRLKELIEGENLSPEVEKELEHLLSEDAPEAVDFILGSIDKMDDLLKGLLRLSRIGRAAMEVGPVDMNYLMKEIANSLEYQIKNTEAVLKIDRLPPARGDISQLSQVFTNIIDNALKYLDPRRQGKINITGKKEGGEVIYCIADNGIGFAPEFVKRVFEIFHRLEPDAGEGEGLGLTIVRKLVDRHGGRVWAESEQDKGSMFFVALPFD